MMLPHMRNRGLVTLTHKFDPAGDVPLIIQAIEFVRGHDAGPYNARPQIPSVHLGIATGLRTIINPDRDRPPQNPIAVSPG